MTLLRQAALLRHLVHQVASPGSAVSHGELAEKADRDE